MKHLTALFLLLPCLSMAQLTTFKAQTTQWGHTANAALYMPDSAGAGETFPTIIYFHDWADRGTAVANLLASPLLKRINSGWKPAAMHPVTGNLSPQIRFNVIAVQGEFAPPLPDIMQYAFDYIRTKYNVRVDTNRIYAVGVGSGGPAAAAFAKYDSTKRKMLAGPAVTATAAQIVGTGTIVWNGATLNLYEYLLTMGKKGIVMPPVTPDPEDWQIVVGPVSKVKKIIVLLKDGRYAEYDSTSIPKPVISFP